MPAPQGAVLTEGKATECMAMQRGRMSKPLIFSGIAILAASALATLFAVVACTLQWLGVLAPFNAALPPQSLVVGGLFLGTPVAAFGWGLVWFGGWLRNNS